MAVRSCCTARPRAACTLDQYRQRRRSFPHDARRRDAQSVPPRAGGARRRCEAIRHPGKVSGEPIPNVADEFPARRDVATDLSRRRPRIRVQMSAITTQRIARPCLRTMCASDRSPVASTARHCRSVQAAMCRRVTGEPCDHIRRRDPDWACRECAADRGAGSARADHVGRRGQWVRPVTLDFSRTVTGIASLIRRHLVSSQPSEPAPSHSRAGITAVSKGVSR